MRAWTEELFASPAPIMLAKANIFKAIVLNLLESQTTVETHNGHPNYILIFCFKMRSCILYVVLADKGVNYPIVLRLNPYVLCVNDYQLFRYVHRSYLGKQV